MNRDPDAQVVLRLTSTQTGGKSRSVTSGYRPNYAIRSDYLTSVHHELIDLYEIAPGGQGIANVWFITPEIYPHSLWEGREIQVSEGSRAIGSATILAVFNPMLRRHREEG
ncbi:hypothetical protein GCM10027430_35630 [Lysobacter tyrosinilyticus]